MQKIEFIKMHGLGNDFVIIDRRKNNVEINKDIIQKLSEGKTKQEIHDDVCNHKPQPLIKEKSFV